MPVRVPDTLPAIEDLKQENIFVIGEKRALSQDIRPLHIAVVNLMPLKQSTETDLLRLLSNTPLQINLDLVLPSGHKWKNTPESHLNQFYKPFETIADKKYDGMIITGAPVETIAFEAVDYWSQLQYIFDWSRSHVTSTVYICWAALAGLYHNYGIQKYPLDKKISGVYSHRVLNAKNPLMRGFDDIFYAPHSRYFEIRKTDILATKGLEILSESDECGVYIVMARNGREIYITGHSEYAPLTLDAEYRRDLKKGLNPDIPRHYYLDDDPQKPPIVRWRSHANLLFSNWLNYFVYQETPYDIWKIK